MGRVLSFTDAVAKSPAHAVVGASGARFSADDIILVMKVGIVFIIIITVAISIWRSFSSATPHGGHLVSSSPAGTVESAANQDGQGIPNRGDAQLPEAGILMNNLLTSSSANEDSTDSTGVPVPTILAAVGANHRMIEMASLALSI
ncbi:unnamed protein product [Sphagnum troendelagicum]|uniref:Uncharacterized protein n=1 Tax=Sphagnum troendelagicum TaxID=128251 RepID=A0ABP0UEG7_9BRYO